MDSANQGRSWRARRPTISKKTHTEKHLESLAKTLEEIKKKGKK